MAHNKFFRPAVESLEDRALPSVSIGFNRDTGILTLNGSDRDDRTDVAPVRVKSNKVIATIVERDLQGKVKDVEVKKLKRTLVKRIEFDGKAGNDTFVNNTAFLSIALGGTGNDYFVGGSNKDYLYGQDGSDSLFGRAGTDVLMGGSGDDTLGGGLGDDRLYGQDGNDTLTGDTGNDSLYGGAGNDKLYGLSGNDALLGDTGNDTLYGGTGADSLYGQAGADYLDGGWDGVKDQLWGGTEKDVFVRYYRTGFLGIRLYGEEAVNDYEGIFGSWDTTREYRIG